MYSEARRWPVRESTAATVLEELEPEVLARELMGLVGTLGLGPDMSGNAYDTAWVARLDRHFPGRGPAQALEWLRSHQHGDGSWGAERYHRHDRVICTLATVVSLRVTRNGHADQERIARGCAFLHSVASEPQPGERETIAFPWLQASLTAEAEALGLAVPRDPAQAHTTAKLRALGRSPTLRNTPLLFSLEAVHPWSDAPLQLDTLRSPNGSIGASPAATAALVAQRGCDVEPSLRYLEGLVAEGDGSVPNVAPIDVFETAWVLTLLRRVGLADPAHVDVRRALQLLAGAWSADRGVAFSSQFPIADADDTAFTLALLRWGGYDADPSVLERFAAIDRFVTYPGEADPSVSVNVHVIEALREIDHPQAETWREQALRLIRNATGGSVWIDKWHASPYYAAGDALHAFPRHAPELARGAARFIETTQRPDGSWGHGQYSTPEETAYALLALVVAKQNGINVRPEALEAAATWLAPHAFERDFTPLWIGKCLYTPKRVVQAAVQAALYVYLVERRS